MPWKFVCDLWFHEVLQTAIIRQITKIFDFLSLSTRCLFFVKLYKTKGRRQTSMALYIYIS